MPQPPNNTNIPAIILGQLCAHHPRASLNTAGVQCPHKLLDRVHPMLLPVAPHVLPRTLGKLVAFATPLGVRIPDTTRLIFHLGGGIANTSPVSGTCKYALTATQTIVGRRRFAAVVGIARFGIEFRVASNNSMLLN